ncbi:hypothetical protein BGZ98_002555 [Dissophora globulifera]|nr:hypothetical protein BGZ98_002555 [Dissophora globulifera]
MLLKITSIVSAAAILSGIAAASGNPGQIVQIESATDWCMMMPPEAGGDIAANEDRAIAFCTTSNPDAPDAKIFPEGFIQSAHFASGDGYVQITGMIDRTRYSLSSDDEGGQYDLKAPVGSACANYKSYVNLIEPHSNTYCIRCCENKEDCNTGKSTFGCADIVPGDYSGPDDEVTHAVAATTTQTKPAVATTAASSTNTTLSAAARTTSTSAATNTPAAIATPAPNSATPEASAPNAATVDRSQSVAFLGAVAAAAAAILLF